MKRVLPDGTIDESGPTPGSAYSSMSRDEYESAIKARNAQPVEGAPTSAPTPTVGQGVNNAGQAAGAQMASQGAAQGDMIGTAGGAMMMSGNPYLMAAGLGLQVVAGGERNKRAAEEKQRQEYNDRIAKRQQIMQQIASQGIQ